MFTELKKKDQYSEVPKSIFGTIKERKPKFAEFITNLKKLIQELNLDNLHHFPNEIVELFHKRSDDEIILLKELAEEIPHAIEQDIKNFVLSRAIDDWVDIEFDNSIPTISDDEYKKLYELYFNEYEPSLDNFREYLSDKYDCLGYIEDFEIHASQTLNNLDIILNSYTYNHDISNRILDISLRVSSLVKLYLSDKSKKIQQKLNKVNEELKNQKEKKCN